MLKIRDFARLAEVSMPTLRYYDEIGLFKPIQVDPETGYRFYTMDQLPHLYRIQALKEIGLGLTQIVAILDEGVSPEAIHGMLRFRQAQLQQHIQTEQEQLVRLEARLRSLEQDGGLPVYEVVLKAVNAITAVSMPLTVADLTHQVHWSDIHGAMMRQYGVTPIDHLFMLHADGEDDHLANSFEMVAPVESRDAQSLITRSAGRLTSCELRSVPRMASTLHQGHPALVMPAYQALGIWMEHNGYTIVGPRRKICLRRGDHLDDTLTEIQIPVEKVA